jgi:hypothetical protein
MHPQLKTAYDMGARTAHADFMKMAKGEILTPLLGSVTPLGAGVVGGLTAPKGHRAEAGTAAGIGSLAGGWGGLIGGAGLGAGAGYGIGRLAKALGADVDPEKALLLGTLLGGGIGTLGGGAYGAHKGRQMALEDVPKQGSAKHAAGADIATPIAGALGPIPAALVGGLSSPEGQGFAGGAGAGGGALLGQIGGGLGGAALGGLTGAGIGKLIDAIKGERGFFSRLHHGGSRAETGGALGLGLGGLAGTLGGGAYGAYKGRRATTDEDLGDALERLGYQTAAE